MTTSENFVKSMLKKGPMSWFFAMAALGVLAFFYLLAVISPERAWQAYLSNFLLWSGVAQGGLLFSAVMRITGAKWSRPLENLSGAFTVFFPVSLLLFVLLFLGGHHVFPWVGHDLHGKELWLNLPFLFTRDFIGLVLLYGVGFVFLFYSLALQFRDKANTGAIRVRLAEKWARFAGNRETCESRVKLFAMLYAFAFAIVLSLIGYDLVMAADPHWISTLFGAYTFVKAFYIGLGGLIILAAWLHMNDKVAFSLKETQFRDIGKLFFGFCLVWADFFYAQFVVIWYGNITEETAYVVERTMLPPFNILAWTVFFMCFIIPFIVLINRRIKSMPVPMIALCGMVLLGIFLEHVLLLGPALSHGAHHLPFGLADLVMFAGFFGIMASCVTGFFRVFPEFLQTGYREAAS